MPKDTVNAVLSVLHDLGLISDTSSKTLTGKISELVGRDLKTPRVSEWMNDQPTARKDLPRLAINALGLNHYGFDPRLWHQPADEAAQVVRTAIGGGIASMIGGRRPQDAKFRMIEYITLPEQLPHAHLGLDQASDKRDRNAIPVPPPTDSLTVRGQATIYARTVSRSCGGLHVRVLIEDILGGKPRFHQVNRYLGLESGLLPVAAEVSEPMSLSFDPRFPAGQQSRIWTILSVQELGRPWLPPNATAEFAHDIPCKDVERMMEHLRMSPPERYSLFMTMVHYQPCEDQP